MSKVKYIYLFFGIIGIIFSALIGINKYYYGDYIINDMWIGNESNGIKYCNNCLWIKFDEGCNHYRTFYFETQHDFDKRLKIGKPVDISFRSNGSIKHISPRIKYDYKCS